MNRKKRLYLAGKITGLPEEEYQAKFKTAAQLYEAQGFEVCNPAQFVKREGFHLLPWETIMRECITRLLLCDGVVLLHDWRTSKGACLERDIATRLNIPVFYPHEPLEIAQNHFDGLLKPTEA